MVGASGGLGGGPGGGAGFFRARRNAKSRKRPRTMAIRTATTIASDDCRVRLTVRVSLAWAPKGSSTSTRRRTFGTAMSGAFHRTAVSPTASVRSGIVWVPMGIAKRRVAATMAAVSKDANTRARPVIPTPPEGDRSAPQGSRYLMFPRLNRTPESPGKSLINPDVRRPAGSHMPEIVESVPNFSEGRRKEVVDAIAQAIASVPGVRVLDQEMDADHNRSVITFVGDRTSVAEAAFRGATKTVELIDMNRHRGEHPRVGALPVLIAWNVNLRTTDVGVAKRIAKAIRESDGGLPAVRAKGFELADRGLVQVSMNMVDYRKTSLVQVFEAIRSLAAKEGVEIAESEIIGLVPLDALVNGATQYFKLVRFHREQILETRLWE